jgi:hypothetical protein
MAPGYTRSRSPTSVAGANQCYCQDSNQFAHCPKSRSDVNRAQPVVIYVVLGAHQNTFGLRGTFVAWTAKQAAPISRGPRQFVCNPQVDGDQHVLHLPIRRIMTTCKSQLLAHRTVMI